MSAPDRIYLARAWAETFVTHDERENVVEYVRADLVAAKDARRIADLEKQLAEVAVKSDRLLQLAGEENARLQRQLAEVRDAALEEAAQWLDAQALTEDELRQGYGFTVDYPSVASAAIRAMKGAAK